MTDAGAGAGDQAGVAQTAPGNRLNGVEDWLDAALGRVGRRRTGPIETTRERPWATVLRAPTDAGDVWLKACGAGTAFEAGLYDLLARVASAHVLNPLAIDAARAWVLLPDGGRTLSVVAGDDANAVVDGLAAAMPAYVELQTALTPQVDELLALGVADMRAERLVARFEEALAATEAYAHRDSRSPDAERHAAVAALRPQVEAWSAELAASPISASLDHNDLHSDNVLVEGGATRFYDFGDSVVAHPFTSALVPITFVRDHVLDGVSDEDPRVVTIRDAFLAPYASGLDSTTAELVPTLELACRLAKIARTLVWQRALDGYGPGNAPPDWAGAPLATLTALLDPSPYGGG